MQKYKIMTKRQKFIIENSLKTPKLSCNEIGRLYQEKFGTKTPIARSRIFEILAQYGYMELRRKLK